MTHDSCLLLLIFGYSWFFLEFSIVDIARTNMYLAQASNPKNRLGRLHSCRKPKLQLVMVWRSTESNQVAGLGTHKWPAVMVVLVITRRGLWTAGPHNSPAKKDFLYLLVCVSYPIPYEYLLTTSSGSSIRSKPTRLGFVDWGDQPIQVDMWPWWPSVGPFPKVYHFKDQKPKEATGLLLRCMLLSRTSVNRC